MSYLRQIAQSCVVSYSLFHWDFHLIVSKCSESKYNVSSSRYTTPLNQYSCLYIETTLFIKRLMFVVTINHYKQQHGHNTMMKVSAILSWLHMHRTRIKHNSMSRRISVNIYIHCHWNARTSSEAHMSRCFLTLGVSIFLICKRFCVVGQWNCFQHKRLQVSNPR